MKNQGLFRTVGSDKKYNTAIRFHGNAFIIYTIFGSDICASTVQKERIFVLRFHGISGYPHTPPAMLHHTHITALVSDNS